MPQFSYATLVSVLPAPLVSSEPRAELRVFKDWAWDFSINDLAFPLRLVEGIDAIVQNIFVRLRFFLGEWFLDQSEGIPYFERVLVKNPDVRAIEALFRRAIVSTPGVESVIKLTTSLDTKTRVLEVKGWEALLSDGSTIVWPRGPTKPFRPGEISNG